MDNYEAFIDDYITIMRKYKESGGKDRSILSEYTDFMNRYNEVSKTFQVWNHSTMNEAEFAYYTEVYKRTTQKMKEVNN